MCVVKSFPTHDSGVRRYHVLFGNIARQYVIGSIGTLLRYWQYWNPTRHGYFVKSTITCDMEHETFLTFDR